MLEISHLRAGYHGVDILKDLSIQVYPKEIVAVIGPNGAGKSTLLKSIFNLCQIHSGNIYFEGKEITHLPTHRMITTGISYVSQNRNIFSNMNVEENLEMGLFAFKDTVFTHHKINEVYEKFPALKTKRSENASVLSGGQQQLLAIARALIQQSRLLLLDEPSLGLDPLTCHELFETIRQVNQNGMMVLIVEQNAKQAVRLAHRTYVLQEGQVGLEGDKELLSNPKLRDLYFGGSLNS